MGIYSEFETKPSELALEAMREETTAILAPAGLRLEWRSLADNEGSESFNEIAVMQFSGECDGDSFSVFVDRDLPLGQTEVAEGRVLPFGKIECSQIRQTLRAELAAARGLQRQLIFGRALGRVLAHELYHILARTTRHAPRGIAKPFYTPDDLVTEALTLRTREIDSIRSCVHPRQPYQGRPNANPAGMVAVTGSAFQK